MNKSNVPRGTMRPLSSAVVLQSTTESADGDLVLKATLKRFGEKNLNGDVYEPTSYDNFINDYYKSRGYNIPVTIQHGHGFADVVGVVSEIERDDETMTVTCTVFKENPQFEWIKALINRGALQGVSDDGYAIDFDYDEKTDAWIVKDAMILNVSIVTTPAEPSAKVSLQNTIVKGFNRSNRLIKCFKR